MRRAFLASAGYDATDLGRPIVGIVDTASDYNTCHRGMGEMVAAVKCGALEIRKPILVDRIYGQHRGGNPNYWLEPLDNPIGLRKR